MAALQPKLSSVRERWADDPQRQMTETLAVYERGWCASGRRGSAEGSGGPSPGVRGTLPRRPRGADARVGEQTFLWVTNLARPDLALAVLAAAFIGLGSAATASESQPTWTLAVPAVSAGVMALMLSAGLGVYLAASGAVATLQGLIIWRIELTRSESTP